MKRPRVMVPFTAMLLAAAISLPAHGASKYKPCSLLTPLRWRRCWDPG